MRIGFIGLGVMGKNMANNILKKGYELKVYDLSENVVKEFKEKGALVGESPAEVAKGADIVMTSLPNSEIVKSVILGEKGILESASAGTVIIDLSSITPKTIQHIAKEAEKKGVEVIDAPVSGGSTGAEKGTLTIMAGGKEEVFNDVKKVLKSIGEKIYYVGSVGAGDTVKLVNNLLLGANMAAVSEALTLGMKAGLDTDILFEIISKSSGNSYALTSKYERFIKEKNFKPGFMIDLQYKDLQLAVDTAKDLKMPLIIGNLTQQMYQMARSEGMGKEDISAMMKLYEKWL
ncbi:2-(hydroxymethyl)glutarate dehydrogenase [Clostridium pasteurianum DSM 525 = ATCC 6013]|uniref:2-(Hydroxymethyl)glutarate dehydrogenase n=1 Tax=Clostridium pasteurianum DSM 525 = ATCC 6013 TaxID=1262449 RepID=A0A0H3J625_CLOPA|nr:NAD(P)-dependent oxidoreductase [Clostridium pasteurianum]AJA46385.1 2-(hydroxymethyl)glutarate dehydrogenase [Clostridium pasteurianum DSM 525 = ATCC 6013]AJA50373.1 2-(hydroxymethyl)glutarate dehydrogenase [Clostridium pasteurianum DSM 525 = ATCC 6013]AOZ73822.1 tRNA methyltransferase [Clostridium pasteurianum DSM 525 = ATCC 6013]AOZ77619.1 tRNA methyltransferase [Clostridium pasteurianum]ELP60960.1 3-hydroxyisobutyrate dehydrogenase [Clostridium pasteurianum DSM 525 = ATCC 6013]